MTVLSHSYFIKAGILNTGCIMVSFGEISKAPQRFYFNCPAVAWMSGSVKHSQVILTCSQGSESFYRITL